MRVRHITVSIARPCEDVYEFLAEPANFERWASGLGNGLRRIGGKLWRAEGPDGGVTVRFSDRNAYGVLDHEVETPTGERILNPMRVVPNGSGSEVVFTVNLRGRCELGEPGSSGTQATARVKYPGMRRDGG